MKNHVSTSINFSEYNSENIWFTADTHFLHQNIIKYCKRPLPTAAEMDQLILTRWNQTVSKNDIVIFLGDFCLDAEAFKLFLPQLNFKTLYFIVGNHDNKKYLSAFVEKYPSIKIATYDKLILHYQNQSYILTHRPIDTDVTLNLPTICGHVHNHWRKKNTGEDIAELDAPEIKKYATAPVYNAGVDVHDFFPINLKQIINEIR